MSAPARQSAAGTHAGSSLARVTAALEQSVGEGRQSGAWIKYCCPVHENGPGHDPSLIVKHFADVGRTKVQCQAGCPDDQILDSIGLAVSDLYDEPLTRRASGSRPRRSPAQPRPTRPQTPADRAIAAAGFPLTKPAKNLGRQTGPARTVATYTYRGPNGEVVGEVVRKHAPHEHGRKKEFYQRRNAQGRMEPGGFAPVPYRLPEVLEAVAEGRTVYIAEGEEDVNAAWRSGVPATCNSAGAGKWRPEHAQCLKGARRVVIIADRDAPGFRHAAQVAESLTGLVGDIRVVAAADGKDLRDHFAAGHELGELEPVPGLDRRAPLDPAARSEAGPSVPFAQEIAATAAISAPTPDGGSFMTGNSTVNLSGLHSQDGGHQHDDSVDRMGAQFAMLLRALMQDVMQRAVASATARRTALQEQAQRDAKIAREKAAQIAAQRKAVETALAKARKAGWDRLSRSEVASALQEAVDWSEESELARHAATELAGHIRSRWGVHVDLDGGHVTIDSEATPQMLAKMAAAEQDRAAAGRLATAQDRIVEMIATEELDESTKQELLGLVEQWRKAPSPQGLTALTKKMEAVGVGADVRTRTRVVALYLGGPATAPTKVHDLASTTAISAAAELRRLPEPLVDLGEVAKHRTDTLLMDYQAKLRHGHDTTSVQARLAETIAVMTPEDQETARERGTAIRANPTRDYTAIWPEHVNRDELGATVRAYAALAPTVEARIAQPDGLDPQWAADQKTRAEAMRRQIDKAIKSGKGLHDLERDQLRAVLTDIEAGKGTVPDFLLADEQSVSSMDRDRADEIARHTATRNRRDLEEILATAAAPEGTARQVRDDINRVMNEQTRLGAGRISLRDFEETTAEERLLGSLSAVGVPEPVRNQVRKHLDATREDAAITGHQARRIQDRWAERRDAVAIARAPEPSPGWDTPERRALQRHNLQRAGLSEDEVRQCMAAQSGRALPPDAAVKPQPDHDTPTAFSSGKDRVLGKARTRMTTPGAGIQQTHHRGTGRDDGLGL